MSDYMNPTREHKLCEAVDRDQLTNRVGGVVDTMGYGDPEPPKLSAFRGPISPRIFGVPSSEKDRLAAKRALISASER